MERFVELVVGGGLALVCGLWVTTAGRTPVVAAGAAVALAGAIALAAGIERELQY